MNRAWPAAVVFALSGLALAPGREPAAPAAWPPPHMRHLPPDYLDRLRASLTAGTARLAKLRLATAKSEESIAWVRYGMPALLLGDRADEINRFFESDTFVVSTNPKFGFGLFGINYLRMYALLNHRTGSLKGLLSQKAGENFERQLWAVAKVNSRLAEAKRGVWEMEGSENHHVASKTCDLLAAQFLRHVPEYANQKYDDGSTLAEQYEARRAYFSKWLDERAKRGLFVEAASPSYQGESLNALFNVRDFAEDPVLRTKAEMILDLAFAVMAEETLLTTRGGPKSRVKVGHEYDGGFADRSYDLLFDAPGRTYTPLGVGALSTSDYYPPAAVVKLARDTAGRGSYSFATRWPGPVAQGGGRNADDPDGVLWRTLDPERSVLRCGFATPDYVLGSAALDPRWVDDTSSGHRWQGVVFAGDPLARIGFEARPADATDWHGFNPFVSVQDRNVLVTRVWAPVPPNPKASAPARLRVYFSPTLDEVREEAGWVFARDGGAFAAVKVVGGYAWAPAWKPGERLEKDNKAFVTLADDVPVILVVNRAADYGNDFAAFRAAVAAQPVCTDGGVLRFATIAFQGTERSPEVGGKPVNLAPARGYDSPFVRSDWNSGLVYIRKGDDTVTLDFRDPDRPLKTVGGPVTAAFPPGVGTARPIIFEKPAR